MRAALTKAAAVAILAALIGAAVYQLLASMAEAITSAITF